MIPAKAEKLRKPLARRSCWCGNDHCAGALFNAQAIGQYVQTVFRFTVDKQTLNDRQSGIVDSLWVVAKVVNPWIQCFHMLEKCFDSFPPAYRCLVKRLNNLGWEGVLIYPLFIAYFYNYVRCHPKGGLSAWALSKYFRQNRSTSLRNLWNYEVYVEILIVSHPGIHDFVVIVDRF